MPFGNPMGPVYLQSGDPENENVASMLYPGQLGVRFTVKQPSGSGSAVAENYRYKVYQYVQTDSTMTVAPYNGAAAWWADKTKYLVTTSASKLGRGRIAGVFTNATALGNFTCIQTKGPDAIKLIDAPTATPTVAGLFVIPSATDGKADVLAAGSAPTYPPFGVTAGALNVGDNSVVIDLDVPETV
jgi:hypothetical protein